MRELIPGVERTFGGEVYIIPPLSLGALQRLQGKLEALGQAAGPLEPAAVSTVIEATYSALRRNYPDITKEKVAEDIVDVGNMHEIIACVMDVAGVKRRAEIEAKKQSAQPTETPPAGTGPGD